VRVVIGNGAAVSVLEEAGVSECDVFYGLSSSDNTNVVAASIARPLGAKKTIARIRSDVQQDQWLFDFRTHFGVDYLFSSERLAAVELAKYIRNPDCLMVEEIARGRIELQQKALSLRTPACGKALRDLHLPARVRVGSIQRGDQVFIPGGDEVLAPGDVVTLFGATNLLSEAAPLFRHEAESAEEPRVVIFGGGQYGLALAQMLEGGRFRTRIFESSAKRCARLSKLLQNTTLIHADGTSMAQLREEQVGEADFFVAATLQDEDNVMTCLQARDLGVRHCITLIHRADYADAVIRAGSRLGILGAVSPRVATSRELLRFTVGDNADTLVTLNGGLDVIEFTIRENSALASRSVLETSWPKGSLLISLTRGSSASVPAADDILQAGDVIAAMVAPTARKAFNQLLH
jgi:trk system potassium uptake protein TrkA